MKKKTNLKALQDTAILLLHLDPVPDEVLSLFLIHPFITQRTMYIDKEFIDVLESKENMNRVRERFAKMILEADDIWKLYIMVHKPYRPLFFKLVYNELSVEDYNEMLAHVWVDVENPNQDANVKISQWIRFFKKADKSLIMEPDDLKYYKSLPNDELITIYRGVGKGREPMGLSWTDDIEVAKWFANRWKNTEAYLLKGQVYKEDIFAYFNTRNEHELLTNVKKVINIERIDLYGDNQEAKD